MKEKYEGQHLEKYNPFPFVKNVGDANNRVCGQIYLDEIVYWGEKAGGQIRISASLVNEKMMNMEYETRESKNTQLFFYEFFGEMTFNDRFTLENLHNLEKQKNELYFIQIFDIETSGEDVGEIMKKYPRNYVFEGEIIFSASPVLVHKGVIVIEDLVEKLDKAAYAKLNATYTKWDNTIKSKCVYNKNQIISKLEMLFDDTVKSREIRIYNVGQANCCYCDLTTKKIFFDIGVTRNMDDLQTSMVQSAVKEISKLDVDAVILSHWDLDHILGACYNRNCLKKKIWIAPDFEKICHNPSISMKRLCNYLLKTGESELLMVDTSEINKLFFKSCNKAVTIYLGEIKASHGVNKKNNGGLLLKLENKKNILLPGDCENQIIPEEAAKRNQYDNVLVPHHGAVMSDPTLWGKMGKKNTAYISCGRVTGNCNLDGNINKKYKKNRFTWVRKTKNLIKHNKYRVRL